MTPIVLPERVLVVPFHRPYAGLVLSGEKPIETRSRSWSREPGWIAVYATLSIAQLQANVPERTRRALTYAEPESAQHVVGIVWISGSRPLVQGDFERSLFWKPGLHAWACERPQRLRRLLSLEDAGLKAPPQSAVYMRGELLRAAGFRS